MTYLKTEKTLQAIKDRQKEWARLKGKQFNEIGSESRMAELKDNLFEELSPVTYQEFARGDGKELTGNMRVVWSSSALVANVFDYWRKYGGVEDLADILGVPFKAVNMRFEDKCPIHSFKRPPNLDVVFESTDGKRALAIESKFTEPYRTQGSGLGKYLEKPGIWQGFNKLRQLAESIVEFENNPMQYQYLDVPQLIKHILGLACKYTSGFTLLYLWYDYPTREAREHAKEIRRFRESLGGEVKFRTMTYQTLFRKISGLAETNDDIIFRDYAGYLSKRYF